MRSSITFHPAAAQDELDRLIDLAAAAPDRFHAFGPGLRRAVFRRFPYYIVFRQMQRTWKFLRWHTGDRDRGFGAPVCPNGAELLVRVG